LIDLFVVDLPRHLDLVSKAINEKDALTLRRGAHTIKGAASNMGAMPLASIASRIEEDARVLDFKKAATWLPELLDEFSRAKRALLEERAKRT
jgi:HPt (histidine-containing phosphotransfer) domain-containing protein